MAINASAIMERKMLGLAWDDEADKQSYVNRLKRALSAPPFNVSLEVERNANQFIERFNQGNWDFVITDLQGKDDSKQLEPGLTIARRLADRVQVFIVTRYWDRVDLNRADIPSRVAIKSKNLMPEWMAEEIVGDLRRLGIYRRLDRVFLIYGHDRQIPGLRDKVENFLKSKLGVTVDVIRGGNLRQEILDGLLERMMESGAFVVLCTPDDEVRSNDGKLIRCQPRQNVLLEMGLAAGLGRGIERLIILQKWGPEPHQQAQFPSDLGGVVPIRLEGDFQHYADSLEAELAKLRVGIRR